MDIEKDISLPASRCRYPFDQMEPGDSFLLASKERGTSARVAGRRFVLVNQPSWRFSLRRVENGWRLWRTV